jgi:hypothetical protein
MEIMKTPQAKLTVLFGLALTVAGCDDTLSLLPLLLSSEPPPELQFVVDHEERFIAGEDHPLKDIIPGTPLDELRGLTGCWGSVFPLPGSLNTMLGEFHYTGYGVYRFDVEAGTATQYILLMIDDSPLPWGGLVEDLELLDNGRIMLTSRESQWANGLTGEMVTTRFDSPTGLPALVSLSGDWMLLKLGATDMSEEVPPEGEFMVLRRFDCP